MRKSTLILSGHFPTTKGYDAYAKKARQQQPRRSDRRGAPARVPVSHQPYA